MSQALNLKDDLPVEQLEFWKKKLAGELPHLALPIDYARPVILSSRSATQNLLMTANGKIFECLAAWRLLLHFYTGQEDVFIGSTVACAHGANLIALRCSVKESEPLSALQAAVRECYDEALGHADFPFNLVVKSLGIVQDSNRFPVFQCHFEYQDQSQQPFANTPFLYDLSLRIVGQKAEFHYSTDLFQESTITRMAAVYNHLLEQICKNPHVKVCEIEIVPETQRQELIEKFNATDFLPKAVKADASIEDLFQACASQFGDRPAVTYQHHTLTYSELNAKVEALAQSLAHHGLKTGEPVAIQLEPSVETMIALLGILRAGGIYLPIDASLPVNRVQYLLEDSGARFFIGGQTVRESLTFKGRFVDLNDLGEVGPAVLPKLKSSDGAYLVYTSGTTGNPKGALIEHRSLVNYVTWFRERYGIDHQHKAALLTSYAFDLGYTTLWTSILSGAHLHFMPESLCKDAPSLTQYFRENEISFIKVTPSLLSAFISSNEFNKTNCGHLKLIVTGGEKVRADDVGVIYARLPDVLVVNHYGPTETTIGVMTYPIERSALAEFGKRPVIGKPIGNVKAYITSKNFKILPLGVAGELLIGGRSVGREYYKRQELTQEKFIPNPFDSGSRVYRSGDLARWTEQGTIEFLGRIDRQVKIRGYRIELSEIEQQILTRIQAIHKVVVIDKVIGDSNRILCAYYVSEITFDLSELRAQLQEVLPQYMIPTFFAQILSIPVTANGKLDTKMLPEPVFTTENLDQPASETEKVLLEMWSRVLGLEPQAIGVNQNFFELGGQSLMMIQLIAEIDNHFSKRVEIPAFYGEGTIRALAQIIDS